MAFDFEVADRADDGVSVDDRCARRMTLALGAKASVQQQDHTDASR
ncbi:MAG: hypothetical protein FWD55_09120 [Propionibacteriaceae bacterium]|nr:hypothetical protein [Propionibacteriaceae bacterium]